MKYLVFLFGFLILIGFTSTALASESRIIDENRIRGDAHPDSCTRWQQWDYGFCVDGTNYPAYLDAFSFLQLVTVPFIGSAAIFVVTTRTPRISKRKRIAVIIPFSILIFFGTPFIFMRGILPF